MTLVLEMGQALDADLLCLAAEVPTAAPVEVFVEERKCPFLDARLR